MRINVTFRHTDSTDALKEYAEDKIRKLTKLLDRPQEANVTLSVEKIRHIAEVSIVADGMTIVGKEATNDLYSAIDKVVDKIERRIKRSKGRRQDKKSGKSTRSKTKTTATPVTDRGTQPDKAKEEAPSIVASDLYWPKPMTVEDAAVELEANDVPLVVFRNSVTMEVCVLHRNSDGTLGLVEPAID